MYVPNDWCVIALDCCFRPLSLQGSKRLLLMSVHHAYRVLGIQEGSSPNEIKNAYRILVQPRIPGDTASQE